ncbi:MAG: hypothetical protein IJB70_01835 [Clostridia bacterium]|nr:hypothetical protein [Clostridia bacterium]
MKKILSLLLALAMMATLAPFAMAEETTEEQSAEEILISGYKSLPNKREITYYQADDSDYQAWYFSGSNLGNNTTLNKASTLYKSNIVIFKFPMPSMPIGKQLGPVILQFAYQTSSSNPQESCKFKIMKIAGESWDFSGINSQTEPLKSIVQNPDDYNAADSDLVQELTDTSGVKRCFVDITSYVQECYNNGQKDFFYVGAACTSTRNIVININWSSYRGKDFGQTMLWDYEDAAPLEMQSATIEDGMEGLTTEKEVSFVFNNGIDSASLTLNGETAKTTVSGATVTLDTKLETFKNYTLVLNVTDVYGISETYTYELVTGGGFGSEKLSDGYTYHITASADPVAMTSKKNIDGRSSHAAVYRIPLPQILQGEALDTFVVTIFPFSQNASGAYKLPGDDWELTTDLNEDGAMLRYADLYPAYLNSDNAVCTAEEKTTANMTPELTSNIVFRHTYDMTRYANECIVRGEQYLDFAVYAPGSTMDVWGFATENWYSEYKATYEYTTYPTEGSREYTVAKFAPADSEAAYDEIADATAISKSATYKAVAKVSNATAHDFDVVIAIADYEDDTLVSVKLTTVTVPAGTRDFDVVSAAIDISAVSDEAKAFVWSESDNYPFALHSTVSIN